MSGRRLGMIRKEEVEEKERFSSTLFSTFVKSYCGASFSAR